MFQSSCTTDAWTPVQHHDPYLIDLQNSVCRQWIRPFRGRSARRKSPSYTEDTTEKRRCNTSTPQVGFEPTLAVTKRRRQYRACTAQPLSLALYTFVYPEELFYMFLHWSEKSATTVKCRWQRQKRNVTCGACLQVANGEDCLHTSSLCENTVSKQLSAADKRLSSTQGH
jgi:hypothetical protein